MRPGRVCETATVRLHQAYDGIVKPGWRMDLDVQPWCEIWLISEGACTMASASRLIRGTVRAVHLSSNGDHLELTKLNGDGVETLPAHYP